jgi:uncharacterized protein YigE (DUF2233 family)
MHEAGFFICGMKRPAKLGRQMRFRQATIAILLLLVCVQAHAGSEAVPCKDMVFERNDFIVCTFDARIDELRLAWTDSGGHALRSFANLQRSLGGDAARVEFAMNAGMYEDTGKPLGLYIENGKGLHPLNTREGSGNFYMKPNGVFSLYADATMSIETADDFQKERRRPVWATQSGPMLVIDRAIHPQISHDGPSKNIRNGVGLVDAHTALFVISSDPVSFGRFARFFQDRLRCPNALYFDGAVSSLWEPSAGREDNVALLGPIVVVLSRR